MKPTHTLIPAALLLAAALAPAAHASNRAHTDVDTFSTATNSSILNPAVANEWGGIGVSEDPSWMNAAPYFRDTDGHKIDWNFDGTYSPGFLGSIRAPVTWAPWKSCSTFTENSEELAHTNVKRTTPALARLGDRLYTFYVGTDNKIHYRQGQLGAKSEGSCASDEIGKSCISWSSAAVVSTNYTPTGLDAAVWDGKLVLAYSDTNGNMGTTYAATVASDGSLSGWSTEQTLVAARTTVEPELVPMYVSSTNFPGRTTVLGLFSLDTTANEYEWYAKETLAGSWTSQGWVEDAQGNRFGGGTSPTLTPWPIFDGSASNATVCGVFPEANAVVRFLCYDVAADHWDDATSFVFPDGPPSTKSKPGLTYHVPRNFVGSPMTSDSRRGQFWMVTTHTNDNPRLYVSDLLETGDDPATDTSFPGEQGGHFGNEWSKSYGGLELYEDLDTGAMKALVVSHSKKKDRLYHLPLADGSVDVQLRDGNDWHIMESGVCRSIRGSTFCDNGKATKWGY